MNTQEVKECSEYDIRVSVVARSLALRSLSFCRNEAGLYPVVMSNV